MNDLNGLLEQAIEDNGSTPTESAVTTKQELSKSGRIRLYMKQHPGVRNKDIVKALSHHGIKAADVANVKSQMKRKAAKQAGKSAGTSKTAVTATAGTRATTPAPADVATVATIDATVGLDVLEEGMEFIRKAGGINEAQHVLNLIRRIRSM